MHCAGWCRTSGDGGGRQSAKQALFQLERQHASATEEEEARWSRCWRCAGGKRGAEEEARDGVVLLGAAGGGEAGARGAGEARVPVWIDVEQMRGSTVDAMALAVENACVVLIGVSRQYKESTNCRLEAQYAMQREVPTVPLMLVDGYRADGWLGMLIGTRMWYGFFGAVLSEEGLFEGKVSELCRDLGDRGRADVGEGVGAGGAVSGPTAAVGSDARQTRR